MEWQSSRSTQQNGEQWSHGALSNGVQIDAGVKGAVCINMKKGTGRSEQGCDSSSVGHARSPLTTNPRGCTYGFPQVWHGHSSLVRTRWSSTPCSWPAGLAGLHSQQGATGEEAGAVVRHSLPPVLWLLRQQAGGTAAKVAFCPSRSLRPAQDQTAEQHQRGSAASSTSTLHQRRRGPHQEAAARVGGAQAELAVEGRGQSEGATALDGRARIACTQQAWQVKKAGSAHRCLRVGMAPRTEQCQHQAQFAARSARNETALQAQWCSQQSEGLEPGTTRSGRMAATMHRERSGNEGTSAHQRGFPPLGQHVLPLQCKLAASCMSCCPHPYDAHVSTSAAATAHGQR